MYLELLFNLCSRTRESKPVGGKSVFSFAFLPAGGDRREGGLKIGDLRGNRDAGGLETLALRASTISEGLGFPVLRDRYARPEQRKRAFSLGEERDVATRRRKCKRASNHFVPICHRVMYIHHAFALCRAKSGLGPADPPLNTRHKGSVTVIVKTIIRHALTNLTRTRLRRMQYALYQGLMPRAKGVFRDGP